jgi:hypothetical protein
MLAGECSCSEPESERTIEQLPRSVTDPEVVKAFRPKNHR